MEVPHTALQAENEQRSNGTTEVTSGRLTKIDSKCKLGITRIIIKGDVLVVKLHLEAAGVRAAGTVT